jgi:DNA helicase-2/ATP-dependent DNA helicase PcrA
MISRAKGEAISQIEYAETAQKYPEQVAGEVWKHYENILKEEHALDFDDLLSKTLSMLKGNPPILEEYRKRFKYVHIDEYQDTNRVQYEIARLLAGERANLCVVGDVDQNIYSWRGADIKNILQFERHFPQAKIIMLEENYRSTQTIIEASNDIIEKNLNRPPKKVFTKNHPGELISLYTAMGGQEEAEYVALTSKDLIKKGAAPSEIAVLFRTNFQSRVLEEAFINFGIPYQMLGTRFFERKEVKDILSFLRLAMNPNSTSDLARVINTPPRGIGKVTLLKIVEGKTNGLTGKIKEKVDAFNRMMEEIAIYAKEHPVHETLAYIMKHTGVESEYKTEGEEGLERLENIRELVTLGTKYKEHESLEAIEHLLEDSALGSDQDELKDKEEFDAVRLMTIHATKGLEFPYVFITGLEEGLFPHERLSDEGVDEEEERRLFYVALTRAQKKVFLSYAHIRTIFGSQRVNLPSSFLHDIRSELLESSNPNEPGYERAIYLD